ncbi:MAG: Gfo/Idh/MocA family protein [Armatimonadota bacterium]
MLKIGLISAGSYGASYNNPEAKRTPGSFHGTAFACTFNGYDPEKVAELYTANKYTFAAAGKVIPGCKVVKVWDPMRETAEMLAKACDIPEVTDTADEASTGVDAVVIVDDGSARQYEYAYTPLKAGIPTFCDKPLAMTTKEALQVQKWVEETGTKFMCSSSLRFIPDIVNTKKEVEEGKWGQVWVATSSCGNDLVYYGIHALSMAYGVFGDRAVSVMNVGQEGRNLARVRFDSGRDCVLIVGEQPYMSAGWQFNLYGSAGWKPMTPDLADLYTYLQQAFVDYVLEDKQTVPVDVEVEMIAALEAGKVSLREGREVTVAEMLAQ